MYIYIQRMYSILGGDFILERRTLAQPSPTQKKGINALFLNCTSVTQWL